MIVLIGGTGTLGKELTRQILEQNPFAEIVSLSRDEQKIQEARRVFPTVRYVVGDVRDKDTVRSVLRGAGTVFLLAAIKHVDIAEQNPLEAIKTNVLGAVNVAEEAIAAKVGHVVYSNTDKAVLSITTYGHSKALAQSTLLAMNGRGTRFTSFAWGNILASRGSVVPIFAESLRRGEPIKLTDLRMSRFWLTIEQATRFMLENYRNAPTDKAMIPPIKAATVLRVAGAVAKAVGAPSFTWEVTGHRGTEKLYEVLESTHEGCLRSDTCPQYTDDELDELIREVV